MKHIKTFIEKLPELRPIPTGVAPKLKGRGTVKAVVFDIYGTLLISSSGDIEAIATSFENVKKAFELCGFHEEIGPLHQSREFYEKVIDILGERIIKIHKAKKAAGIQFPEVEVREVWQDVFRRLKKEHGIPVPYPATIQNIALVYEVQINKVYPMPDMIEVITKINASGLPLGIISNAQFYTPIIMNYYMTGHLENTEYIPYFKKDLSIFSYKVFRGKPDPTLFEHIRSVLEGKYGINRTQVLYIGNDMLKDILPAKNAGFKTVLFAGDQRSLRMHDQDDRVKGVHPDFVITSLYQIRDLL